MRPFSILPCLLLLTSLLYSQTITSRVDVFKVYSENGEYFLHTIPFDKEEESLYGKTYVYKVGQEEPIYSVDRNFNYTGNPNKINLSNNGLTIFYINDIYGYDEVEEQRNITVYRQGDLLRTYALADFNDCDNDKQDCYLLYKNREVISRELTNWIDNQLVLGFVENTSKKERFANQFNVFARGDSVYLLDQFKKLRVFDFQTGQLLNTTDFDSNYSRLSKLSRSNSFEREFLESPSNYQLPMLTDGREVQEALGTHLDMVTLDVFGKDDNKYKRYTVHVDVLIHQNGKLEILELKVYDDLPEQKIQNFLTSQTFDSLGAPPIVEKWRFEDYLYFRNKSKSLARKEKEQEDIERHEAYLKRLTQDSINGFYIPRNLGECFVQLDTLLAQKIREEMKALPDQEEMIRYHFGLGTYLRNNWGLWGGSRLQTYFSSRGVRHPDSMSGVILDYYYDWLNGKVDAWKEWEKEHEIVEE